MPIEKIAAPDFFQHLSEVNYDKNFTISGDEKDTKPVGEEAKPGFLKQVAMWLVPDEFKSLSPSEMEVQAQRLVDLIKKYKTELETNAKYKPEEIANNLARKATEITQTLEGSSAEKVQEKFNEAFGLLTAANHKKEVTRYSQELKTKGVAREQVQTTQLSDHEFYQAFGRKGWFGGKFNERLHVINKNGQFEFHTSPRLSFATRWSPFSSSDLIEAPERKEATVTQLANAINAHRGFIVREGVRGNYDVDGMIAVVKSWKGGRLTRNTNEMQANAINAQMDKTIRALVAIRKEIKEIQDNTFSLTRFVKNWIILPIHNRTTGALYNKVSNAVASAWNNSVGPVVEDKK